MAKSPCAWVDQASLDGLLLLALEDRYGRPASAAASRPALPAALLREHVAPFLRFEGPLPGMLYVIGGRNRRLGPLDVVEMFDTWHGEWVPCPPMPTCRAGAAAAGLHTGEILVVGGYDHRGIAEGLLRSCDLYDPRGEAWRPGAPLRRGRWGHGCAQLHGTVLAVGGCSTRPLAPAAPMETLRSCEAYDPATDAWSEAPPLQVCRSGARLVSLPGGRVAAVGGCDDVFGRAITQASVEIFDARRGAWELLAQPLLEPRTSSAVAALGELIFVAGGGASRTTAEVYPLRGGGGQGEARSLKLSTGRMGCQGAVLSLPAQGAYPCEPSQRHRCVAIVGGEYCEEVEPTVPPRIQQLASIAVYDLDAGAWQEDKCMPPLSTARTTAALCVASGRVGATRLQNLTIDSDWFTE